MKITNTLASLSDDDLLRRLAAVLRDSRHVDADLIAHIAEVDARGLYRERAASSMFVYCTDVLHFSEQEAYLRISVARATREHRRLLDMLADGRRHLTGICKLAPHLTADNRDELLMRAAHRSKRQIAELIAELQPQPDVPALMRKLPARRTTIEPSETLARAVAQSPEPQLGPGRVAEAQAAPIAPARVEPLAPTRYKVQFTASAELRDKLTRLQALMRCSVPDGDLAAIIEQAVSEKLERLEARRFGKTKKPRMTLAQTDTRAVSRHVPAAVRRSVHSRDSGRCSFVDDRGRTVYRSETLGVPSSRRSLRSGWRPQSREYPADVPGT